MVRSLLRRAAMLTDPFGTNKITYAIRGCAIKVHEIVGPGVYEAIYSECLQYELREAGLSFEVNRAAPLIYKGVRLKAKYYLDLVVEGLVVAELKSVAMLLAIHKKQLLSQLRLTNLPVGLLINFNVALLSDGGHKANYQRHLQGNGSCVSATVGDRRRIRPSTDPMRNKNSLGSVYLRCLRCFVLRSVDSRTRTS